MGYKDIGVRKEYQHNWYLRKKKGLTTATKLPLSKEEVKKRIKERQRKYSESSIRRKQELKKKLLGNICFICGRADCRLRAHRKDGKIHKDLFALGSEERLKNELQSGDYVHLCYRCHKGVHFCMDVLGLSWENIIIKIVIDKNPSDVGSIPTASIKNPIKSKE